MNKLDLIESMKAFKNRTQLFESSEIFIELIQTHGENVLRRTFFNPGHLTASSVCINTNRTHMLLLHHKKLDLWIQPGGHIDGSWDILGAAKRELIEETGVQKFHLIKNEIFMLDKHLIPKSKKEPAHFHFDISYLFELPNDFNVELDPDESLGFKWEPILDISPETHERTVAKHAKLIFDEFSS